MEVTLQLSVRTFKKLADFLAFHESDIADGVNDFDDLMELYKTVFEETPKGLIREPEHLGYDYLLTKKGKNNGA